MNRKNVFILVILSLILLVFPNGFYSAFDKDEPKYLEAAYEMVKTGDYITPYYNYEYRFDKPILIYWLIVLGYKVFGVGEFGGRFLVSFCGLLTVFLIYWWLCRWKSEKFAFWSSLVLLSLLDFIIMSSVAMPDIVLTFFITASLIFFFEGYHRKSSNFYRLAFLFSGLATLTKGPVGLVLPGIVAVVYLILRRDLTKTFKTIPWFSGFAIYFAIILPWYGAVLYKHGYQFFKDFIIFHNIQRFTGKIPGHPTEWWYYLANYFWIFLPYSLFFPFAVYRIFKEKRVWGDNILEYSTVWFFVIFLFFQIAHTKLAHYLLPSFPAFAVITTWYLFRLDTKLPLYLTAFLFTTLALAGGVFWSMKQWPIKGLLFIVLPLLGVWWAVWSRDALRPITAGFIAGMILFKWVTLSSLEPLRAKPYVARKVAEMKKGCKECKVVFLDYSSPEIVYYYRLGKLESLPVSKVKNLLKGGKPVLVITRENRLKRLKGAKFYELMRKKELLPNHSVVVISNYPGEKIHGRG